MLTSWFTLRSFVASDTAMFRRIFVWRTGCDCWRRTKSTISNAAVSTSPSATTSAERRAPSRKAISPTIVPTEKLATRFPTAASPASQTPTTPFVIRRRFVASSPLVVIFSPLA